MALMGFAKTLYPSYALRRPRADRHSLVPDHCCGEVDEASEVRGSSVIACGEAPEVFESAEAALDPIALPVDVDVVRNDDLAGSVGRDDRCCPHIGDDRAQRVAVIGL